jgi:hypothetical protein
MSDDTVLKDMEYYLDPENEGEWEKLSFDEKGAVTAAEGEIFQSGETVSEAEVDPTDADAKKAAAETKEAEEKAAAEKAKAETDADDKPVIQAKDGRNVIPYERLEEATAKVQESQGKIDRLEQTLTEQTKLITDLQEAAKQDAAAGKETGKETTAAIDAVKAEYEGEYPEMMEDIGPHLEKIIAAGSADLVKGLKDEIETLKAELAPVKETVENDRAALEQADKTDWQGAQESFWQDEENQVFQKETNPMLFNLLNSEVVNLAKSDQVFADYPELLAAAKQNVMAGMPGLFPDKPDKPTVTDADLKAEAEKKLAKLKEEVPTSLSDVPGSSAVHHDEAEAAVNMGMQAATGKFMQMDPDQIEEYYSKVGL